MANGTEEQFWIAAALGQLTAEALRHCLAGDPLANFQYLRWQTVTEADLESFSAALDPCAYDEAWAFGENGELHWARETWFEAGTAQQGWRVVYVGARAACPPQLLGQNEIDLADYEQGSPLTVKLWGERRPGQATWFEARIPRRLDYPWPDDDANLGMTIVPYRHNGRIVFTRMTGLSVWP